MLRRSDYEDFLIRVYFGDDGDALARCLRRAYRDFNRTLHGINDETRREAEKTLSDQLSCVRAMDGPDHDKFDAWHQETCEALAGGKFRFAVGQSQKWINMTFKYIYVMGKQRIDGFDHLYDFCHVPIDNILMDAVRERKFEPFGCAWSRLDRYSDYMKRQRWFREQFKMAPLDAEHRLWLGLKL